MPKTRTHYVGRFVVERVERTVPDDGPYPSTRPNSTATETNRQVKELASVMVKADDVTDLISKLNKHLGLVEDMEEL